MDIHPCSFHTNASHRFDTARATWTYILPSKAVTSTKMYDYHPPIPSSGVSDPESPDSSLGDCAICMEVIYAEDPRQRQQVAGGLLHKVSARRNYSLAPCSHLFHTECLEK
ncbi:hypothetical protein SERLA73DRAFT_164470, partial [Serpula lacrymans var. lacrymans S7.3]